MLKNVASVQAFIYNLERQRKGESDEAFRARIAIELARLGEHKAASAALYNEMRPSSPFASMGGDVKDDYQTRQIAAEVEGEYKYRLGLRNRSRERNGCLAGLFSRGSERL